MLHKIQDSSMPRNKNGHNIKQQNNHTHGRTFTDNRTQQERLAKFLEQKQKKQNRVEDRLEAQQQLAQREQQRLAQREQQQLAQREQQRLAQREQQLLAQLDVQFEAMFRDWERERERHLFAPLFNRHREQHNQHFNERIEPENQDNHFNGGHLVERAERANEENRLSAGLFRV